MNMKNLLIYYIVIIAPLPLLVYCSKNNVVDSGWVGVLILIYAFPYRLLTDYYRLRSKAIIDKNNYWEIIKPFSRMKYFRALYWI